MKVLQVIPAIAPCYGGPSRAIYEMSRALQLANCEVQIATTDADGAGHLPVELQQVQLYQGVPTIFFKRQQSESFKFSQPLAQWLSHHIGAFDVVHIHAVFSHASVAAAAASRQQQVPYIVRTIGNLDPWSMRQSRFRKRLFWQLWGKQMLQGAAAVHYTAQDEQRLVETTLGLGRGVTIPLGVGEELLQEAPRENCFLPAYPVLQQCPYLLTLCRLHPKKNLEALIEVFLKLTDRPDFQRWKLVIAGEGDPTYTNQLHRLVKQQGGEERVVFTGWLQGEVKRGAFAGADLFVLPSHQENFGLSVVEAMACGVPVIISEHVNLATDITAAQAGWVVKLGGNALSNALQEAMGDDQQRIRCGTAARRLVTTRFTWPAVAIELMKLYAKITKSVPLEVTPT